MTAHAELFECDLPEFGLPEVEPVLSAATYRQRLTRAAERAGEAGCDVLVVYGDREHYANIAYQTGYDPRFEEALLLLPAAGNGRRPVLLVGNEGLGYTGISPIQNDLEIVLYQSLSLLGQDRRRSRPLDEIFQAAGIGRGTRVGTVGWKYFSAAEADHPATWLELPAYMVDLLRGLCGDPALVQNATALFMDSSRGLRALNEVEQLARFEFVSCYSSQALRRVLFGLRPGMTELEAVELMRLNGLPFSCHLMLSAGPHAVMGLPSPSARRIERGDPFTMAVGLWGALNARAGFVAADAGDLPEGARDYVARLVGPYFEAIAAWYETVGIGVTGGELYRAVMDRIGDRFFGVGLNPGHLIHLDEWVHSPIYAGSTEVLQAGMALQVDVIPATGSAYFTTNIEDGIALADDEMRAALAERYPGAWQRIQARRAFMEQQLGLRLKPEVLPFSNIPAYLTPYLLAPRRALRIVREGD